MLFRSVDGASSVESPPLCPQAAREKSIARDSRRVSAFFMEKLLFGEKLGNAASPDAAKNMTACSIGEIPARHKPGGGIRRAKFFQKITARGGNSPFFTLFANRACTFCAAMVQDYAENTAKEFAFYEIRYRRK